MLSGQWGFVTAAYAITSVVIAALITWIVLDIRRQRQILSDLEARGVRRRSELAKDKSP